MKEKDYKNYLLEDFLLDDDFRSWVHDGDKKLDYFWQKWMDSHPEKVEDVLTARQILYSMKFMPVMVEEDERGDTLQNIIQRKTSAYGSFNSGDNFVPFRKRSNKVLFSIAASIALLIIAAGSFYFMNIDPDMRETRLSDTVIQKSTVKGQKLTHTLPDGSKVILNSESQISYVDHFHGSSRMVRLTGEAFFEVVEDKSRPFTVITGNTSTQVLGTSFNVNAFPENNETKVSLLTGKVRVFANNEEDSKWEVFLEPGQKVSIDRTSGEFIQSRYDFVREMGWKENILVFDKADHESVVKELERWYGVNITTVNNPPLKWEIKGHFKDASLEEVLESLQYTNKIEFKIENKNVELKF